MRAFARHPDEVASFVERIRASEQFIPELALVAEDSSGVSAHVMLSWVGVEGASRSRILNLTPMSVRPDRQRLGVGSRLIRDALGRAEEAGEPAVMVEGIPAYYPRFGFERGSALGFISPHPKSPTTRSWSSGCRDTAPTLSATDGRPWKRYNETNMDDLQKARLAQNEDFFREVNDRISESAESHGSDSHRYEFFCECSDASCMERVSMTLLEYEHIRAEPTRFVVKKNHVIREIEHVVETVPDHMVIEKHGEAGRIAVELEAESTE